MSTTLAWLALLLPVVGYIFVASGQYRRILTLEEFFSYKESRGLIFSLVAANLSFVGVFFGLLDGAKSYGWLVLAAPLTTSLGVILFSYFVTSHSEGVITLVRLQEAMQSDTKWARNLFLPVVSISMIIVYMFTIGFEVFVFSQLFTAMLGFPSSVWYTMGTAILLIAIFIGYTVLGGFSAVVKTDKLQMFLIVVLLGVLLHSQFESITALFARATSAQAVIKSPTDMSTASAIMFLLALSIINIAAQFMNPTNWHICGNCSTSRQVWRVYGIALCALLGIWMIVILVGFSYPGKNLVYELPATLPPVFAGIFIMGLVAALFSTVDSLMLASSKLIADLREQCFHVSLSLSHVRRVVPILYGLALLFMLALFLGKPGLFNALVAISSAMVVYVPLFIYIYSKRRHLVEYATPVNRLSIYTAILFVMTAIVLIIIVALGQSKIIFYVAPFAFTISSIGVLFVARAHDASEYN